MRTIIFLNGIGCPITLAKSPFVWHDSQWTEYNRIYQYSRVPTSDTMVERELSRLSQLISQYDNPIIAGHSLGAWWAANLACRPSVSMDRMVLFSPLGTANTYPIFNVSNRYDPAQLHPNPEIVGPHKSLVFYGNMDIIVPHKTHALPLIKKFQPTTYVLKGGHFLQANHLQSIQFMKEWIESGCQL